MGGEFNRQSDASDEIDDLSNSRCTEMALISTTKPWSGNKVDVSQTKPMRSRVASRTIPVMMRATLIYWIIVTARKTTARPRKRFSMATERM